MRRFIIRDIITKKQYFLNHRKIEFSSISAARDFISWMSFNLGNYYEVYDTKKEEITFNYKNSLFPRVKRK